MADPVCIPVYFDFASTVCFFTDRVLARLQPQLADADIQLLWSPIDLTVLTGWLRGKTFDDPRRTHIRRLSDELAIPVEAPTCWMDSRPALATAVTLVGTDEVRWRTAVWQRVYQEGHSLDEPNFLEEAAEAAGLVVPPPGSAAFTDVERRSVEADELGVLGVPTFLLDAYPLGFGIQDEATMLALLVRFAEKKRGATPVH
ncbi:MAG: DsbA family protein [Acidobacteriota bacterium]|nr:DsbA family protein [Acidobacteriota bacterium]